MKMGFVVAGVMAVVAIAAAQNRGFDPLQSRPAGALDADRDGVISADEIRSAASTLKSLDANGDGRLSADELRPAMAAGGFRGRGDGPFAGRRGRGEEGGAGPAPATSADALADTLMAFDRNGDGELERGEVPGRFQGLFDRADANKDGVLTKDELTKSASATEQADAGRGRRGGPEGREFGPGGRGGARIDPVLRALDVDHDGSLSAAEIAGAPKALEILDANHDGRLDGEEIRRSFGRGGREGRGGRP